MITRAAISATNGCSSATSPSADGNRRPAVGRASRRLPGVPRPLRRADAFMDDGARRRPTPKPTRLHPRTPRRSSSNRCGGSSTSGVRRASSASRLASPHDRAPPRAPRWIAAAAAAGLFVGVAVGARFFDRPRLASTVRVDVAAGCAAAARLAQALPALGRAPNVASSDRGRRLPVGLELPLIGPQGASCSRSTR